MFGILERVDKVHVEIVKNVKAKTLLHGTIKKVKRGSTVYTGMSEVENVLHKQVFCA